VRQLDADGVRQDKPETAVPQHGGGWCRAAHERGRPRTRRPVQASRRARPGRGREWAPRSGFSRPPGTPLPRAPS